MTKNNQLTKHFNEDNLESVIDKFYDKFWEIPFENSAFQNNNFVINAENTPGRAFRHIGLRMSSKLQALQEAYFGRKKEQQELKKIELKIKKLERRLEQEKDEIEKEIIEADIELEKLELEKKQSNKKFTDKLIRDAITELETLNEAMGKLPSYNKEEFEKEEEEHFKIKLEQELRGVTGALKSLDSMGYGIQENKLVKTKTPTLLEQDNKNRKRLSSDKA